MSLEEKLREKYKEDIDIVDDVEELILDELLKINEFTQEDKEFLEKFKILGSLSMSLMGLTSLNNFPNIPTLNYVLSFITLLVTAS